MNSQPLVSVIALNHDQGKFLVETLDSVRNQTYKNIELIICDDYSSDDSKIKINKWIEQNNYKAKLIFNEQNLGVVKSSNRAIKQASGYYSCFIACDDIMLPDKLTTLVNEFSSLDSSYMAIYTDAQLIDEENKQFGGNSFIEYYRTFSTPPSGIIFDELKKGDFIPWPSLLFKNEVFKKLGYFDENLIIEDWDFLLRLSKQYKIHYSKQPLVKYRFHPGNIHSSNRYEREAKFEEFKTIIKHLEDPYCLRRCKSILVKTYLRGYYRFEEILPLYKTQVGNDFLSGILSFTMPFIILKKVNKFAKVFSRQKNNHG